MIYVPASAGVPLSEIQRWRQQLLHGYVPPNLAAGSLGIHPNFKLYWGDDTNLYRASAGVLQTDGTTLNINSSGGTYEVNGSQIGTSNLGDWTNTGVADGKVPIWDSATGKWTPGNPAGLGTVTGTGTGGYLSSWSGTGGGQSAIQDSHLDDGVTTAGTITSTEPLQVSGMPSGCVQFPCVIGKVAPTTYTSTSNGTTTSIATISTAGQYKLCVYFDTVVAGTGGSYSMLYWYGGDSHVFQNSFSGVSVNSQWQQNNSCVTFYADSGAISYQIRANSVTGAPTLRYAMTAEQLQ